MNRTLAYLRHLTPFDVIAVLLTLGFLVAAVRTPSEGYDIIGPKGWPLMIAIGALALLALRFVLLRKPEGEGVARPCPRFWYFCGANVLFGVLLPFELAPFYVVAAIFITLNHLLLANAFSLRRAAIALVAALVFCFAVQTLFTDLVYIDL